MSSTPSGTPESAATPIAHVGRALPIVSEWEERLAYQVVQQGRPSGNPRAQQGQPKNVRAPRLPINLYRSHTCMRSPELGQDSLGRSLMIGRFPAFHWTLTPLVPTDLLIGSGGKARTLVKRRVDLYLLHEGIIRAVQNLIRVPGVHLKHPMLILRQPLPFVNNLLIRQL